MTREDVLAMEPGRELDALVAEKVMGWTKVHYTENWYRPDYIGSNWNIFKSVKNYSTDISEAWEVVEKVKDFRMFVWFGVDTCPTGYRAMFRFANGDPEEGDNWLEANGSKVPEAICKCALLAVMDA